MGKTGGTVKA